ncbi:MAG: polyprenyl synthetase family protein [Phycisphaerales bacterium]
MLLVNETDVPELAALLTAALEDVAAVIEQQLTSELPSVNRLCRHIERYRGKMLRPTLVILCGVAARGETQGNSPLSRDHVVAAAVTELIHMATLVHDDVLDESRIRRRAATINALYGNEMAVMLGDYLISNAFALCSSLGQPAINQALGRVTNTLCEGELLQLYNRDHLSIDEATYLEIVTRKTASLIGEACALGAEISRADVNVVAALRSAGQDLGVAFQIQDDLLDLIGKERLVGKSLGLDLEKGKLTLPFILYLAEASPQQRGEMLRLIEQREAAKASRELIESGSIEQAQQRAADRVRRACAELSLLPPGPGRDMLLRLAQRIIDRET